MSKRYVLIDYMHLVHKYYQTPPLHTTVNIDGEPRVVDTTIPSYTIKSVYSYSGRGTNFAGVFLEGGKSERKAYFANQQGAIGATDKSGYKGNRSPRNSIYQGVDLAVNLMNNGGVSLYRMEGMEADDLIASAVRKIKSIDQITPIDIITNDSDMLPLVDEQVSVYMRGSRQYAVGNSPEHRLYYQVTPETWQDFLSYSSAYGSYHIPYNSMLLFKLIRGDKADNVAGACKGYGGKKYSDLMYRMEDDGVDFPSTFRYGLDFDAVMRPVLENYFDKETVDYMKYIYVGISPRWQNVAIPKQIDLGTLQKAVSVVHINLIR